MRAHFNAGFIGIISFDLKGNIIVPHRVLVTSPLNIPHKIGADTSSEEFWLMFWGRILRSDK